MIDVQKGVKVDLLRVRVRLSDIEQRIITEENRLDVLHRLLANQLGLESDRKRLPVRGELSFEGAGISEGVPYKEIYTRRQDYQALKAETLAAGKSLATAKAAIDEAKEALDIEQLKYSLDKGTIVDVLDAQDALLKTQTNHARAMAAYNTDLARLALAEGEILKKE